MSKKYQHQPVVSRERLGKIAALTALTADEREIGLRHIEIARLRPNPYQPRKWFDDTAMEELRTSIEQYGILEPLIVRQEEDDTFTCIAGHRRWKAADSAGLVTVPVVIREANDEDLRIIGLIENLQRQELHTVDKVRAFRGHLTHYDNQTEAAKQLGMNRAAFNQWIRAGEVGEQVLELVACVPTLSLNDLLRLLSFEGPRRVKEALKLSAFREKRDNNVSAHQKSRSGNVHRIKIKTDDQITWEVKIKPMLKIGTQITKEQILKAFDKAREEIANAFTEG